MSEGDIWKLIRISSEMKSFGALTLATFRLILGCSALALIPALIVFVLERCWMKKKVGE